MSGVQGASVRCFACHGSFNRNWKELAYVHTTIYDQFPPLRGICQTCKDVPRASWIEHPPADCQLKKMHVWSPAVVTMFEQLKKIIDGLTHEQFEDFSTSSVFYYHHGPDGETGSTFTTWARERKLSLHDKDKYLKDYQLPLIAEGCLCCPDELEPQVNRPLNEDAQQDLKRYARMATTKDETFESARRMLGLGNLEAAYEKFDTAAKAGNADAKLMMALRDFYTLPLSASWEHLLQLCAQNHRNTRHFLGT